MRSGTRERSQTRWHCTCRDSRRRSWTVEVFYLPETVELCNVDNGDVCNGSDREGVSKIVHDPEAAYQNLVSISALISLLIFPKHFSALLMQ